MRIQIIHYRTGLTHFDTGSHYKNFRFDPFSNDSFSRDWILHIDSDGRDIKLSINNLRELQDALKKVLLEN